MQHPTAILLHRTREGSHYDWLLSSPGDPLGPLWTARIALPPGAWAAARLLPVQRLPDHRRVYLEYQGPLSQGRGEVLRIDRGGFRAELWTAGRIVIDLRLRGYAGRVELRGGEQGELWTARFHPSPATPRVQGRGLPNVMEERSITQATVPPWWEFP